MKLTTDIEYVQFTGDNIRDVKRTGAPIESHPSNPYKFIVRSITGLAVCRVGDFVIRCSNKVENIDYVSFMVMEFEVFSELFLRKKPESE